MHDFHTCFLDAMVFGPGYWMRWFSVHGIGRDGFQSMVLNASACINMYCNIERSIMKNQSGSHDFGIQGKSLCITILCFMLSPLFILCF